MLINTDYITPAELTGYARTALADQPVNQAQLAQWLPNRDVNDLSFRFTRGAGGLTQAAEYRAYDAEAPIGSRPGVTRVSGELPPISRKIRLGEYDRLRQRALGADQAIRTAILSDAENMTRSVAARIEKARGDALVTGSVTIAENGVIATVDFGRAAGHTVNANTLWSDLVNSKPVDDLDSWSGTYSDTNGVAPGAIVMSKRLFGFLARNAQVKNVASAGGITPSIVSSSTVRDVLDAYDLPPIYIIDSKILIGTTATRIIPDNRVLLLPAPGDDGNPEGTDLGATQWGTTSESLEPEYGLTGGAEPGIVAGSYKDNDPVAIWTKSAAISIPVLANPDLSFCATAAS